jgi:uncharacterized protein
VDTTTLPRMGEYRGPAPVVHPESEAFWRGLGEGRLTLQRCARCATVRFPVAPLCWHCGALEHEWVPVATRGTVSAAVTVHRATGDQRWAAEVPFVTAQVDTADGHRLPGRVLDPDGATPDPAPGHGTPVHAGYLEAPDAVGVLCFVLDRA